MSFLSFMTNRCIEFFCFFWMKLQEHKIAEHWVKHILTKLFLDTCEKNGDGGMKF